MRAVHQPRERLTGIIMILALVAMGIGLGTLLWLEGRVEEMMESEINLAAQNFEQLRVLGEPRRPEGIRFSNLRSLVEANRRGFIREIWVSKEMEDGSEHLLWPLTAWFTVPDWRDHVSQWERHDLGPPDDPLGHLHFDIDRSWLSTTALAARSVGALIVLTLLSLLLHLRGTSHRLEETTDALVARQRELIHIERLALAGQLSANVLHDIRKPVLNIRHGLGDLEQALGEFDGVRKALEELRGQTDLFQSILRETNLERFVQARDGDQEYLDITEVLRHAAALVRYERRDVEVLLDFAPDLPAVLGSRHRLVQVFSNIILNAYQAMEGKGHLTLRAKPLSGGVLVEIEDTGPGIAPEIRDRLFEPFVTTKPTEAGTGLGLMICRLIIEQMGGTIGTRDTGGRGALFAITLPTGEGH
ncbi:hypothetical protein JXA47_16320 [Candidatus Sumerlaeota bacterium]|nr:hypothetical protein [Candidatus Sumerlaeota bacterium]